MGLFNIQQDKLVIDPTTLPIPEFRTLWDRDKLKTKESAYEELSYVYYMTDFNSPYMSVSEDRREDLIIKDFIKRKNWKPDEAVIAACNKYRDLSETPNMRLLRSVRGTIDRLGKYMDTTEIDSRTVKSILETMSKVGIAISTHDKLEEAVKKQQTSGKIRGDKKVGLYER